MYLHVVTIEYSLTKPDSLLGDEVMCPLFHSVSSQCPVLHLFGYVNTNKVRENSSYESNCIAGATETENNVNQRSICVHVHGVYPYFMVFQKDPSVSAMQFGAQLETVAIKALKITPSRLTVSPQILHRVEVVKLLPFYGYHAKRESFYKVSVIDPAMVSKLNHLLCCTTQVGGQSWQTYEAHAPYHFQFMVDYGLRGMTPFLLRSCTARAPLPSELRTKEQQTHLNIAGVTPIGEPPRLTCAELEVDVAASVFYQQNTPVEPGENLRDVRSFVRQYIADFGAEHNVRREELRDTCVPDCKVRDVQNIDPAVASMRRVALTHLRARATTIFTSTQSFLNEKLSPLNTAEENCASSALSTGTPGDNLTVQLMEEIRECRDGKKELLFSSESCFSLSCRGSGGCAGVALDVSHCFCEPGEPVYPPVSLEVPQNVRSSDEENREHLLLSSGSKLAHNFLSDDGKLLVVGDSIVLCNDQVGCEVSQQRLIAKITEIGPHSLRLRWYMSLCETHLADCQKALEKSGRWLAKGMTDVNGITTATEEELLLGDVEDENSINILTKFSRVLVRHSYRDWKAPELLCRYNYHIFEKRLSLIESDCVGDDDEIVAFPAVLFSPLPSENKAEVFVGEGEELFATSPSLSASSLFFSSSSSSSSHSSSSASETHISTLEPLPPSLHLESQSRLPASTLAFRAENCSPIVVRRSVSDVQHEVEQSQLSLLISCSGLSPPARSQVSLLSDVSHFSVASEPSFSLCSSSVEIVDNQKNAFLKECGQSGGLLQPCRFMDNITRCFRWTYDQHRNCVVVSAASWPFATMPSLTTADKLSTEVTNKTLKTETGVKTARQSVPLLTYVAGSQTTSLDYRCSLPDAKPKWQPRLLPRISNSVDGFLHATCDLRVMCVEVLINRCHGEQNVLREEEILAVALGKTKFTTEKLGVRLFCVCLAKEKITQMNGLFSGVVEIKYLSSELQLLRCVRREICCYDPDIILSWEGVKYGIGFIERRYNTIFRRSFARDISRFANRDSFTDIHADHNVGEKKGVVNEKECVGDRDECGQEEVICASQSEERVFSLSSFSESSYNDLKDNFVERVTKRFGGYVRVAGRIVISLGKQLRKELRLPSQTLHMVYQKLFNTSMPYFTDVALAGMYKSSDISTRRVALSVLLATVVTPHRIAQHINFYTRTAEFSRMHGILFHEVLCRGSQYRVEATLHRMAKPMGYAMLSPPLALVQKQPRLTGIPLIMQPRSGFYQNDPVVVLDFRSLYPSIIIAYNICYSTCLGKVFKQRCSRLGVMTTYKQADALLLSLLQADEDDSTSGNVTIAPNGCMFFSPAIREGVLPKMLRSLLEARLEVLAALNYVAQRHEDTHMQRVFSEQQAAIKMLANTTYGYTAASFTGRMPCVEVADAIVMFGRQTLGRAMQLINGHPKWNAEVVYGDTDSLFVRLPGRTKEEAFFLGEQIAKEITAINPAPIQLKFEKVLFPCLLLVKKRYVGCAYFKPDQKEPEFFAKGIETVRRDQCPATSRLAASMLHALFSGASTEALKLYFYKEISKLVRGECSPVDCIFYRAVKLGKYTHERSMPVSAHLAKQLMEKDIAYTPYWGERLPYVVVRSMESTRLRDQVVHPRRLLSIEENLRVDSEYYIRRHIIPTLDRMFQYIGVSVAGWYATMPKQCSYTSYFDLGVTGYQIAGKKTSRATQLAPIVIDVDAECDVDEPKGELELRVKNQECRVKMRTLDAYYQQTLMCAVCLKKSTKTTLSAPPICSDCLSDRVVSVRRVIERRCKVERHLRLIESACRRCIASCGEKGGPNYVFAMERDIEDMCSAVPHLFAAAAAHGEETEACVSIDCRLSFEKRHVFCLYTQLVELERYVTRL